MITLKQCMLDCNVSQREFAGLIGWSATQLNRTLNLGQLPKRGVQFAERVEKAVSASAVMSAWLSRRNKNVNDIWEELPGAEYRPRKLVPRDHAARVSKGMLTRAPGIAQGNPEEIEPKEVEMITPSAMRHFKLFRSPFANDISDTRDIFFSEDHIFLREMMLDTARYAGFTAVYGEVGSGKSVMRRAVVQDLMSEDIRVVFPIIVDKERITPGSLIDAIILDISEEKPRRALEEKSRQALRLLRNRATSGMKQVLIVEEAHLLSVKAMKALKQIFELEDGFGRLIGIILIGQPELKFLLDETRHPEMREVIMRVTCAEISGLGKDLPRYLAHKFARINKKVEDIFEEGAFDAMEKRLQNRTGRGVVVSLAHPLRVNNVCVRAMNLAAQMGEPRVSADVVMNL